MTYHYSPDAVLERIPELAGKKVRWHVMPGGLTNRNFRVDTIDKSYVLRLESKHSKSLSLDRSLEREIRASACSAELGAAIIYAEDGILLSDFLPGIVWQERDLIYDDKLAALAELLRKVHKLPQTGCQYSPKSAAGQYVSLITKESGLLEFAGRCQKLLELVPPPVAYVCCHNDIVVRNIVQHASLKLLDWEYACDNDQMFDLASLIGYHDLGKRQIDTLFSAYTDGPNSELFEQLQNQIRVFDVIQWLWFAACLCVNPDTEFSARLDKLQSRISF